MRSSIVLSGICQDAERAADWARKQAVRASYDNETAVDLGVRVQQAFRAACTAFFEHDGERQMLMLSLDLSGSAPRFELISDGEQARGTVSAAQGLGLGERRRNGLLDGLTCVSIPA